MLRFGREEFLGSAAPVIPVAPAATSSGGLGFNIDSISKILEQINTLLSNPFIQGLIGKQLAAKMGAAAPQLASLQAPQPNNGTSKPVPDVDGIYKGIVASIASFKQLIGDVPLSQVEKYLIENETVVKELIKKNIGSVIA
jgi:hypothetical protein